MVFAIVIYLAVYFCLRTFYRQLDLVASGGWYVVEMSVPDTRWMPTLGEDALEFFGIIYSPVIKIDERMGGKNVFWWREELALPKEPAPP